MRFRLLETNADTIVGLLASHISSHDQCEELRQALASIVQQRIKPSKLLFSWSAASDKLASAVKRIISDLRCAWLVPLRQSTLQRRSDEQRKDQWSHSARFVKEKLRHRRMM